MATLTIFVVLALVFNCMQYPRAVLGMCPYGYESSKESQKKDLNPINRTCATPPSSCTKSKYRTIDGSCNNLDNPGWGIPNTPYGRLVSFNYGDGIYELPRAKSGKRLPLAREISLKLFPDLKIVDKFFNLDNMQWGQIITHDMSLTAGVGQIAEVGATECCGNDGKLISGYENKPICAPIVIPKNDPVHAPQGTQCLQFARTATTIDEGCAADSAPADPISNATAYMDLSLVYGHTPSEAQPLRAGTGGRLKSTTRNGQEWPPQVSDVVSTCNGAKSNDEPCYLSGDIRVNQNTQLTVLQIILFREHNRLANALARLNPHWDDETIFQEARRINIAQNQRINYYEYLPGLLGFDNMVKRKLIYPRATGYIDDYNSKVNPSVLAEHATAAFRHFHTLIFGHLMFITENRQSKGSVRLSDWLNRPLVIEGDGAFEDLVRGLATQAESASDQYFDLEVTQYLFKVNHTFGKDLRSIDIQRGRDHGLIGYANVRAACGLSVIKTFQDMTVDISEQNVAILQDLYDSPEDVDLVVGGSLEKPVSGALVGPTFLYILTEQFYRTRVGDRYFYENGVDPDIALTPSQLDAIRKGAFMSRLLCDNSDDIQQMQLWAFQLINDSNNKLMPCDQLPSIDLSPWKDTRN